MDSHFSHTDPVTLFGILFIAAILTNWWLARRNAPAVGIGPSHVDLLLPLALVGGIAGGSLLAWLLPQDQQLAGETLAVSMRLRLFGIVACGALVVFAYSRLNALSFRSLLDVLALPTIVAIGVHRLGCFYAGCCWGDLSGVTNAIADPAVQAQMQTLPWLAGDWVFWSVRYGPGTWPYEQQLAVGLIGADALRSLPVHPVQLYEVAILGGAYLFLRRLPLDGQHPGRLAALTILSYALGRFALEFVRADGTLFFGNLTLVQLQCIALIAIASLAAHRAARSGKSPGPMVGVS